MSRALI